MIQQFLKSLENDPDLSRTVRHQERLLSVPPEFGTIDPPLPAVLQSALETNGIPDLYSHQTDAIRAVRRGENVVVVTPTASGKSLTYFLPIAEAVAANPEIAALLIFPLKALEQDQLQKLTEWEAALKGKIDLHADVYDGDTPQARRRKIKQSPPNFLITNPDMLHQGILAYHQGWEKMLRRLKYIVIDELHAYRGIFGSHILQVLRRLSRLLAYYDVTPQFICLSATIANPLEFAEKLTGRKFTLIDESGAPVGPRRFLFLDPGPSSVNTVVAKLFAKAIDLGLKTIVFSKARVTTEVIYRTVTSMRPDLVRRVSSYRAGFLAAERREIEHKLATGELAGVVSTNALELGIDIGGLDVCILVGYPGSIMSTWQRAGRVGRRGDESAIVMVTGYDALDHYFLTNPAQLFSRSYESALINDANEEVLKAHLPSAAAEMPLMHGDPFIDVERYSSVINGLVTEGQLIKSASGKQWFPGASRPHSKVSLRSVGGTFEIGLEADGKTIGEVSGSSVFRECHEGAIYLHRGDQYQVTTLDLERKRVLVQPLTSALYTIVRSEKQTEIIDDRLQKNVHSFTVHHGKVKVTETYHSYERRRLFTQELLSVEPLDLPPQSYVTDSTWVEIPQFIVDHLASEDLHYMGGIHAFEHAAISLIPLFALCDRNDVGGISFTRHKQLSGGAVFFYDGYPGGAGIAEHVYEIIDQLIERTHALIKDCACDEGCPSCIQSPKCGSGNKPLDKRAAIVVLEDFQKSPDESVAFTKPTRIPQASARTEEEPLPWTAITIPPDRRVVVFDLETQKLAEDVGGWSEIRQMRLAIGIVWDSVENQMFTYDESQVEDLIAHLKRADLVIGYNQLRFDYEVLRGYTFENLRNLPTLDLLIEVQKSTGFRLKLDSIASATLGSHKSADGVQSVQWFKEGRLDLVTEYCIKDVEITRDVLLHALEHGYVLFDKKNFGAARIPLRLQLEHFWSEGIVAS